MRLLRALAGAVLWILAALVGLLGALLCVTVIGLPLGIPLIMAARRLFGAAVRLMLPRHVAHPVQEAKDSTRRRGSKAGNKAVETGPDLSGFSKRFRKRAGKELPQKGKAAGKKARKKARKKGKKGKKAAKKLRKKVS
jgi:hypothetical protein